MKVFRQIGRCLALVWAVSPRLVGLELVLNVITGLVPVAVLWLTKLIVDELQRLISLPTKQPDTSQLMLLLGVVIGLALVSVGLGLVKDYIRELLRQRLLYDINKKIINKALELDLTFFENPQFYDKLVQAQREASYRPYNLIYTLFSIFSNLAGLVGMLSLLFTLNPLVTLAMFVLALPLLFTQNFFARLRYQLEKTQTEGQREMGYFSYLLTNDHAVKEIKLFGLGQYLVGLYEAIFNRQFQATLKLSRQKLVGGLLTSLIGLGGYGAALVYVVLQAAQGNISLGGLAAYIGTLLTAQNQIFSLVSSVTVLYENSLFLDNLFDFLALKPIISQRDNGTGQRLECPLRQGFELRGVSFSYPNTDKTVLKNINLDIRPGETIALVGENGAGKTTLAKLLCRLYDPTEGSVSLNGVLLSEYSLPDLQRHIGVIFQDYVRYWLTARENIGFGNLPRLHDTPTLETAARKSGANEVIEKLSEGYDTRLGAWFEGSDQLSGGQWQRIALARAFFRDSEAAVLMLDEPTASLDARVEYETFQRFRELTAGKIAVLISHRFSSVRMADRIIVLEGGEIVEEGSHTELLALGGRYAKLFQMQASGYQ